MALEPFELPSVSPLLSLRFRRQVQKTRTAPFIPVAELLTTPPPQRQKYSACFHWRNLTAVALTGGVGLRNEETRQVNFEDFLVFALDPLASRAVGRLEDVLAGAIALDDRAHALVIDIKDPKNNHERYAAVVDEYRETMLRYAREYVVHRVENARSQRSDARKRLQIHFGRRYAALESGTYKLKFAAGIVTRALLETRHELWSSALEIHGPAILTWPDARNETVDEDIAEELLAYLLSFADGARFSRAKQIFRAAAAGRVAAPADLAWLRAQPVLLGPVMFSRKGGAICEVQLRYIFKIYGWHKLGYLPQSLRSNWQRFHKKYEAMLLDGGAKGLGHANTRITGRSYDAEDVYDLVRIARVTAQAIRKLSG